MKIRHAAKIEVIDDFESWVVSGVEHCETGPSTVYKHLKADWYLGGQQIWEGGPSED